MNNQYRGNISSIFFSNSEANASEFFKKYLIIQEMYLKVLDCEVHKIGILPCSSFNPNLPMTTQRGRGQPGGGDTTRCRIRDR